MGILNSYNLRQKDTKSQSFAQICSQGASLVELEIDGVQIIPKRGIDEISKTIYGSVLAPWPNRLNGGVFSINGRRFSFPVDSQNNANHGLLLNQDFKVAQSAESQITLSHSFGSEDNYPFAVDLEISYTLNSDGLSIAARAKNRGDEPAPFAIGFHPYFAFAGDSTLNLEVSRGIIANDRQIPIGEEELNGFSIPLSPSTEIDNCYAGISPVALLKTSTHTVEIRCQENLDYLMVYHPMNTILEDGGQCLAIEPMSNPANAYNTELDKCLLSPGETREFSFEIVVSRRDEL